MTLGPILCVDDDPHNLEALRRTLADEHRLVFARTGLEALSAVAKHAPSLVLLDIEMPGIDGYETCRRLKTLPGGEDIRVIFITARAAEADETAGFAAGGIDYITKPISPLIVQARVRTHLSLVRMSRLERSHRAAIAMLGVAGHYNDNDTGVHIWRMGMYSRALARAVGWPEDDQILLELAAPLHDTGKIGIPDAILKKPGPLTAEEWVIMRTHPTIGHEILAKSDALQFRLAAEVALGHHERWDGNGYPNGLAGTDIPESARIVAVADVFDALCMKRPYKEAWPVDKALDTLRDNAGTQFEPRLVAAFHDITPEILAMKARWDAREAAGDDGMNGPVSG